DAEAGMAERVAGCQVVINAAGLVRGRGANTLEAVHAEGAERLFHACVRAGVPRLIHISALGASSAGITAYQRTKGRAEDALAKIKGLDWCVLRPSVVVGRGGASTTVLAALAALPLPPRIGPGTWRVQPVHVDDLAALVVRLVEQDGPLPRSLDVVGPEPMTTDGLTAALRAWLGLQPRPFLLVPEALLGVAAAVGERLMDGPMNREIVTMLKGGNVSNPASVTAALGRPPRRMEEALARHPATEADRWHARLFFLRPLLRWSLGLLWVATGLLSFGLYPVADSHRMLAEVGLSGLPADAALYGAAAVDLALGALLLARWRPVAVGTAMLATMAAFSLIALGLPAEYWLHPFAPLLKNLPIAAATLVMMALEA
ncbi:MAG TPA: SDR family oxidoreductase, partial [Candidatus Omnitrophota bacterium]|nr:SDR family oxidoreductase [Candidatus Omnitrophota bacterium]